MIVLDVETTGTNPELHSLLSLGAVDLTGPDPETFSLECRVWPGAHVDPEALKINGFSTKEIDDPTKPSEAEAVQAFLAWVGEREEEITIAGQNPFFDRAFVGAAAARAHTTAALPRRVIDLHSITYFHMIRRGIEPPRRERKTDLDSDAIMAYVGLPAEPHPHKALNGARWEAEAFYRLFYNEPLFEDFKTYPIPWLDTKKLP